MTPNDSRLGVNLLHAPASLTGTGHYAQQLIHHLLAKPSSPQIHGFCTQQNRSRFQLQAEETAQNRYTLQPWGTPGNSVMLRRLEEWFFLERAIKKAQLNLFWGPSNFLPWRKVCPYLVSIHDMTFFRDPQALGALRRTYWHQWTRRTIALADHIVTVSHAAKADIVHYGKADPDRITVIYNGTNEAFFLEEKQEGRLQREANLRKKYPKLPQSFVFFLGTLTTHKNVPRLIDAIAQAKKADGCQAIKLVVSGKRGFGYEHIQERINHHRLGESVIELGYTEDSDLPALYEAARCHILPSTTEGFGLPITEAMAAGTPTITGNAGATAEVAGNAALLVDPHRTESIAEALVELWRNNDLHAQLRQLGFTRAKTFRWDKAAQELLQVVNSM